MSRIVTGGVGGSLIITQGIGGAATIVTRGCVHPNDAALYSVAIIDTSCNSGVMTVGFNIHDYGDLVRVSTGDDGFTDEVFGGAIDPDVVNLTIKSPDAIVTTYVYGTDAEVVKDDVGKYHADIDADQAGVWYYRWWSTGTGQASEERRFQVRAAQAVSA